MIDGQVNFKEMSEKAIQWTKEAAIYIREQMEETFTVSTKAHQHDLVTDVDKNVEAFFIERVRANFPTHRIMGEEGSYKQVKDLAGIVWLLDPIDGTVNFVHQESFFAISIGIFYEGEPIIGIIYDVMKDEMFSSLKGEGVYVNKKRIPSLRESTLNTSIISFSLGWSLKDRRLERLVDKTRGIRCYGSAALELAYVASGRLDAYISLHLSPWDLAGGYALIQEVGGKMTNYEGKKLSFLENDTLIAANPWVYTEIVEVLNKS